MTLIDSMVSRHFAAGSEPHWLLILLVISPLLVASTVLGSAQAGAGIALTDSVNLGLSLVYVNLGDAEIRTTSLRGDYKRNHGFVIGMTLAFKELPWSGKATFGGSGGGDRVALLISPLLRNRSRSASPRSGRSRSVR